MREHLAIQLDPGFLQTVHKIAVAHAQFTRGGVDANDPKGAKLAFADAPIAVRITSYNVCYTKLLRQETIRDRELKLYAVDADRVAHEAGLGPRINTVMQACFFALSGVLPRADAIRQSYNFV